MRGIYSYIFLCVILSIILSGEKLCGSLLEIKLPFYCHVEAKCGYTPPGDFSTNCSKEKFCEHRDIIVNKSKAQWFYVFVDGDSTFANGILPSLSFVKYHWQHSVGVTYKNRNEWDPNFNRNEDPMPADPETPTPREGYIIFALNKKNLDKAVKLIRENKEKEALKYAHVIKVVISADATKGSSVSTIVLLKPQVDKNGIKMLFGNDAAKAIEDKKLSEIAPNKV